MICMQNIFLNVYQETSMNPNYEVKPMECMWNAQGILRCKYVDPIDSQQLKPSNDSQDKEQPNIPPAVQEEKQTDEVPMIETFAMTYRAY